MMLPDAFLCDIDGTITCVNAWKSFEIESLPFNKDLKSIITSRDVNGYPRKIVFLTARPESLRKQTEDFLKYHFRHISFTLYMRPEGDFRKDVDVKRDIYTSEIAKKYHIVAAFDDKRNITRTWRSLGIQAYVVEFNS